MPETDDALPMLSWFLRSPVAIALLAFQIWMAIDAVRRREWIWALFVLAFPVFGTFWYYFSVYRESASATRGFELPGSFRRKRIQELQAQIHHLDKAHHYSELGDLYFQQGKLDFARQCYEAALEREPGDIDTRAHHGQCLLRQGKPAEARPLLEGVVKENPKHDYGHTQMAYAETLAALGETEAAVDVWRQVTANHSYPRARVQLAELLLAGDRPDEARKELLEVLMDDPHTPAFQRRRDRVWVKKARALNRRLG